MDLTHAERVQRGARVLDNVFGGPGWREQVQPRWLNVASTTDCVLGQVFGDFYDGLGELGYGDAAHPELAESGFDARLYLVDGTELEDTERVQADFRALTEAWTAELSREVTPT